MSDQWIWMATAIGVLIIAVKLLVVFLFRRLAAMEAPDQEQD